MSTCSTSDSLGTTGTIVFSTIYGVVLICTSIYSYRSLSSFDDAFKTYGYLKRFKLFAMDLFKRRKCYLPIITHLMDQITDISVVISFGQLAANTSRSDCGGLNMNYLFILSIFTLLFYRTISSFIIFYGTRLISRFIFQFLDLELFRTLYINYLCDNIEPCSPQRWITSLEAIFESAPQSLITTIYLIKTDSFRGSPLVLVSLLFSLRSIIGKIVSDDKMISIDKAKSLSFRKSKIKTFSCISWLYVARYFWRILDVSCRIFASALLWLALGGWYLFLYFIVESLIFISVCIKTKRYEYLFGMVSMTISKSNKTAEKISQNLMWYRISMNFIVMGFITFFTYVSSVGTCWQCPTYADRQHFIINDKTTFSLFIYCWCCILIIPLLSYYLYVAAFKGVKSNARTLKDMIKSKAYNSIIEMQVYKGNYGIFNENTSQNLLMLCCQQRYGKLARYIFALNVVDPTARTTNDECILDYLSQSLNIDTIEENNQNSKYRTNKNHLFELFINVGSLYPFMISSKGCTALQMAFYIGNVSLADRLLNNLINNINESILVDTLMTNNDSMTINFDKSKLDKMFGDAWYWSIEGDQPKSIEQLEKYTLRNENKHDTEMKIDWKVPEIAMKENKTDFLKDMISQKKINILRALLQDKIDAKYSVNKQELWFYATDCNDVEILQSIKDCIDDINIQNEDGNTVLHMQCLKEKNELNISVIKYLQTICDINIRNKKDRTAKECLGRENMYFEHCENQITVYIIQARNLPHPTAADPDPYINVSMNTKTYKTNIIRNCINPIYNSIFSTSGKALFSIIDRIRFDLYYDIKLARDDFIGGYTMKISPNKDSTTNIKWITLKDNNGKIVRNSDNNKPCEIQIKIKYRENAKELNVRYYTHLMQLKIIKSTIIGVRRCDPYVICEWGAQSFQTDVIDSTVSPEWNSIAFVYLHEEIQSNFQLKLTVMDKDRFTKDDLMGTGYISAKQILKQCINGEKLNVNIKIRKIKGNINSEHGLAELINGDDSMSKIGGELEIEILLIPKPQIDRELYKVLLNKFDKNNDDGDGVFQKSEFEHMFGLNEENIDKDMHEETIRAADTLFHKFDENKDETLDENDIKNMMSDRDFQASKLSTKLMALYAIGDANIPLLNPLKRRKNITNKQNNSFQTIRYLKDRETGLLIQESVPSYISHSLKLILDTKLGRAVMQSDVSNKINSKKSRNRGITMDSEKSNKEIATFIKQHSINTKILCKDISQFKTFNDFFARQININQYRPMIEYRNNEMVIVSPA
eukprot:403557_1